MCVAQRYAQSGIVFEIWGPYWGDYKGGCCLWLDAVWSDNNVLIF
jgi:hypothetical protein